MKTLARLNVMRRNGKLWVVLGVTERERRNSFLLDCIAEDGEREEFTMGRKGLDALRWAMVKVEVPDDVT